MPGYFLEALIVLVGLVLLMLEAFLPQDDKRPLAWSAVSATVVGLVLLTFAKAPDFANAEMARFYAWDPLAVFMKGFLLIGTALTLLLAVDYRKTLSRYTANPGSDEGTGEYYALVLFACAGMMWMVSAKDLVSMFISLELTTISFYVLVAYMRRNVGSLEAGVKYLILGALSTGFLVYGISWIYGGTGSTELNQIAVAIEHPNRLLFGLALVLVGLAFKVGAVPLHLWVPDVYQGAATPTTAFLSVASKGAGFVVALRVLEPFYLNPVTREKALMIVGVIAVATILVGNLGAISQNNFKRLLAYSSIANAGFLLMAVAAWQSEAGSGLSVREVVGFFMATYLVMTFAAFFILVTVQQSTGSEEISAFNGLGKTNPLLALCATLIVGALAGLPLTAGFLGKFFAFQAAIQVDLWVPVVVGFIGVTAGFYYYFKVIRAMYWVEPQEGAEVRVSNLAKYTLGGLTVLVVVLGVWPAPIFWQFN